MSKHIKIFDTTLRDGEQSPGCSMNREEKIKVAQQLEKLGVDIIEAGFAISSKGDFDSIVSISESVTEPIICSLARAIPRDIETAAKSLEKAKKKRIHTFIATSPIHMEYKLKMSSDQVLENAVKAVSLAKSFVDDVEFSCEDAGRSEPEFLVKVFSEVIKAGATVINVPDTVGYMMPQEYAELIRFIKENTPGVENVDISAHCHDDLGVATANSLAGVLNGVTQIECTINGIGERAGNTSLEEVVMAIKTRSDVFNAHTNVNTQEITRSSRLVVNITGSPVQPNKAIVGANAFAHEAGIHQDGILKAKRTYEIMDAEMVGLAQNSLVLGKHSGRHAFKDKLSALGIELDDEQLNKAFVRFKELADKKKEVMDEDIEAIVVDETASVTETYELDHVEVNSTISEKPTATVRMVKDGESVEASAEGEGSVNAIYKAIDMVVGEEFKLQDYIVHAVTGGTDAIAEVAVRIVEDSRVFSGRGADLDVLMSSAKAYVMAVNKLLSARGRKRIKASV